MSRHDEEPRERYRIQRRRLGRIISVREDKNFGFIEAEDFREDVFFHFQAWEREVVRNGRTVIIEPEVELWVEFELDEKHLEEQQRLRASTVCPTDRPEGRKLSGRDATFQIVVHHENARRKRPTWRK